MTVRGRWLVPLALTLALATVPPHARSQSGSPVIEMLRSARDARTRVQAAHTLGRLRPPGARAALEGALSDTNAAVRAAAVEALVDLGDAAALGALRAHANDADAGVRAGIARAVQELERRGGASAVASSGGSGASGASGGSATNWSSARYVVRVGNLSTRVNGSGTVVDTMRNAIAQEIGRTPDFAFAAGQLPPEAEQRVRQGRMHEYSIAGTVTTLRTWTVATTMNVRAEVSLVLTAEPGGVIVGSLSGAATAQDGTAPGGDANATARRLEERALAGAVHGALNRLHQSLTSTAQR